MENLYTRNGLIFWDEHQINKRDQLVRDLVESVRYLLKGMNQAFDMIRCEAPLLTPVEFINPNYTSDDYYSTVDGLVLRPETTMGSYAYAQFLLRSHKKIRLPLCIWQVGKSFRREQDQPTKFMRLKEFYQLEFQCLYSTSTANDYAINGREGVRQIVSDLIGRPCSIVDSDRLPSYATETKDIICDDNQMEVASMSKRTDFPNVNNWEIAIGVDRLLYNVKSSFWGNLSEK